MAKQPNKKQQQNQAAIRLIIMAAILICINVVASYYHTGIDLTSEKRFTLTAPTKKLLRNMQEVAVIEVYMKGKFPAGLQRLQEAIRERLVSFKAIAGSKIIFRFSDPFEGKDDKEQQEVVHDLGQKGIMPLQLQSRGDEDVSMKVFFPFALVKYNGKEVPVQLLENLPGSSPIDQVSYSEALLEYKFAHALNQLNRPDLPRIGYMMGNGEDLGMNTVDMLSSIADVPQMGTTPPRRHDYKVDTLDLGHLLHISLAYDAIIINHPVIPFSGPDKLKIDQYIMRGGHVLWALNTVNASLDSLKSSPQFIALDYGLELDALLFKYGVRINNDLVEDMQCLELPRHTADGQMDKGPWPYFPRLNPTADNPIVKNMDYIAAGFSNSIDTIKTEGIEKTILLQTSKYSRSANAPVRVSMGIMNYPLQKESFTKPYRPVAVLLEGRFYSAYLNHLAPEYLRLLDSLHETFKPRCDSANSMIVTSVGDIFNNDFSTKDGPLLLGYYKWTGEFFANKSFLLNSLEYLTDKTGILASRSKQVKLRLMDGGRVKDEKVTWQALNVGLPVVAVLIFASAYLFFRKRRYEVKAVATAKTQ